MSNIRKPKNYLMTVVKKECLEQLAVYLNISKQTKCWAVEDSTKQFISEKLSYSKKIKFLNLTFFFGNEGC